MMQTGLFIAILFILMIAGFVFIPRFMIRRAISQVISIFQQQNIFQPENAKTAEELGLSAPGFMKRMTSTRDYKPTALEILYKTGIILATPEGKLYMAREKLDEFLNARGWK